MKLTNLLLCGVISACVGLTTCTTEQEINVPIVNNTQNAIAYGSNNLSGGYVLAHTDDLEMYFDFNTFSSDNIVIDFFDLGSTNFYFCNPDQYSDYFGTWEKPDNATITYLGESREIQVEIGFYETTLTFYLSYGDNFQDIEIFPSGSGGWSLQYLGFNAVDTLTLNDNQMKLFNTLFVKENNSSFVYYTGWYTINNNLRPSNAGQTTLYGAVLSSSYLYEHFYIYNSSTDLQITLDITYPYNNPPTVVITHIYNDGTLQTNDLYVYFNAMLISEVDVSRMEQVGAFMYVPPSSNYDLSDLFFNIADTPVQFIVSLFSFELFGMQFYIAFLGIITVIAMVFILKKVV